MVQDVSSGTLLARELTMGVCEALGVLPRSTVETNFERHDRAIRAQLPGF
jgi:hypothetical protein